MSNLVRFAPEAVDQLEELYSYISRSVTPAIAAGFCGAIVDRCEGLSVSRIEAWHERMFDPGLRTMPILTGRPIAGASTRCTSTRP